MDARPFPACLAKAPRRRRDSRHRPRGTKEHPCPQPAPQAPPLTPAAIARAGQILADAHKAMGGDKLKGLTSILVTGQTRRVRGDNRGVETSDLFRKPRTAVNLRSVQIGTQFNF